MRPINNESLHLHLSAGSIQQSIPCDTDEETESTPTGQYNAHHRCHGVMVSMPGPTSRRRQSPAVPAGPEWHNTAASATPCVTLRESPRPFPHCRCPRHTAWAATEPTTQPGPHAGPCAHRAPNVFSSVKKNKFCMGTHPMPPVLPEVINSAWAHTQCLQFCHK